MAAVGGGSSPFGNVLQSLPGTLSLPGGKCLGKSSQNVLRSELLCLRQSQHPPYLESPALRRMCPMRKERLPHSACILCLYAQTAAPVCFLPSPAHSLLTLFRPTPLSPPCPSWMPCFHITPPVRPLPTLSEQDHLDHRYSLKAGCWHCLLRCDMNLKRHLKRTRKDITGPLHVAVGSSPLTDLRCEVKDLALST